MARQSSTLKRKFAVKNVYEPGDFVAAGVPGVSTVRFKITTEKGDLKYPNKYPCGLTLFIETAGVEWIDRRLP
ncbi:hypothetical protein HNR05_000077 [Leifsonia psychrotolerans]|uniref:Uncharacterized protein n=1 Tax=Glaciibacter psychrotolerans TaxID=670054 RepID=A0A7Z0EB97_9MICO|nr:hypothetical protein [Leifsonia psychrotolerans]